MTAVTLNRHKNNESNEPENSLNQSHSTAVIQDKPYALRFKMESGISERRRASLLVLVPLLGVMVFTLLGFAHNIIPSESMEPNLRPGDHILTVRDWLAYPGGAMPARGDVIVFRLPKSAEEADQPAPANGEVNAAVVNSSSQAGADAVTSRTGVDILIKRVIGLPGDTVQIKDNDVFINGKKLKETYHLVPVDPTEGFSYPFASETPLVVPPGHLFVLGDNRTNSDDGRYWGTLDRKNVIGKFVKVLYHDHNYDTKEAVLPNVTP